MELASGRQKRRKKTLVDADGGKQQADREALRSYFAMLSSRRTNSAVSGANGAPATEPRG